MIAPFRKQLREISSSVLRGELAHKYEALPDGSDPWRARPGKMEVTQPAAEQEPATRNNNPSTAARGGRSSVQLVKTVSVLA